MAKHSLVTKISKINIVIPKLRLFEDCTLCLAEI